MNLNITEIDAHGATVAEQAVPIGKGAQSGNFHGATVALSLVPEPGATAILTLGNDPRPLKTGIAVTEPMTIERGGARCCAVI
jgi:hypothetical protein